MKRLLFLFILVHTFSVFSQGLKQAKGQNPLEDYNVCQDNHHYILNSLIGQSESQISRLLKGVFVESSRVQSEKKMALYYNLFLNILFNRIILNDLSTQLNKQNISTFYSKKENENKPILKDSTQNINLEKELKSILQKVASSHRREVVDGYFIDQLVVVLAKSSLSVALENTYQMASTGLLVQLVMKNGAENLTKSALSNVAINIGSNLFISASRELALDLLTIPLKGYRLPPATLWLNLLEKHPELIIMPEWMKHGGINDHPWTTHCGAMQWRKGAIEKILTGLIEQNEIRFLTNIVSIDQFQDNEIDPRYKGLQQIPSQVDNLYLKREPIPLQMKVPEWALVP